MEEKIIGGRYEYKRSLGKGGNGSVFLCFDTKLQKEWAVKELCKWKEIKLDEEMDSAEPVVEFEQMAELELLKSISCNLFPRIVDVVYEEDKVYLVMDYIEGVTLKEKMQRQKITEKEVLLWALEIAKALQYLHRMSPRILYMDCKPENIILTPQGEIRLVDLGSVYICGMEKKQRISGTRFFSPKEQHLLGGSKCESVSEHGVSTDIYAFGMTLYYLLAGKKKIVRRKGRLSIRDANPAISQGMNAIIARCTENDPLKRLQSMEEVIYRFEHIREIDRQERIKNRFVKMVVYLGKCACAVGILAGARLYAANNGTSSLLLAACAGILFFLLCKKQRFTLYEVKKEVFYGSGKKVLCFILLCINILVGIKLCPLTADAKQNSDKLSVTIYDDEWRKLLIKNGFSWAVEKDIFLSVPVNEIGEEKGMITVIYTDLETKEEKEYSFLCHRK